MTEQDCRYRAIQMERAAHNADEPMRSIYLSSADDWKQLALMLQRDVVAPRPTPVEVNLRVFGLWGGEDGVATAGRSPPSQ